MDFIKVTKSPNEILIPIFFNYIDKDFNNDKHLINIIDSYLNDVRIPSDVIDENIYVLNKALEKYLIDKKKN